MTARLSPWLFKRPAGQVYPLSPACVCVLVCRLPTWLIFGQYQYVSSAYRRLCHS